MDPRNIQDTDDAFERLRERWHHVNIHYETGDGLWWNPDTMEYVPITAERLKALGWKEVKPRRRKR